MLSKTIAVYLLNRGWCLLFLLQVSGCIGLENSFPYTCPSEQQAIKLSKISAKCTGSIGGINDDRSNIIRNQSTIPMLTPASRAYHTGTFVKHNSSRKSVMVIDRFFSLTISFSSFLSLGFFSAFFLFYFIYFRLRLDECYSSSSILNYDFRLFVWLQVVFGGCQEKSKGDHALGDTWIYDLIRRTWYVGLEMVTSVISTCIYLSTPVFLPFQQFLSFSDKFYFDDFRLFFFVNFSKIYTT